MRNLLFSLLFTLIFFGGSFAQTDKVSPCPTIKITSSASVVVPGETITFTVSLSENFNNSAKYDWTVSAGTIIEGQGSPIINVAITSDLIGTTITATVTVKGLPENCVNKISEQAVIDDVICRLPVSLDEYGKIPLQNERARLSHVALELRKEPMFAALFIINFTKEESLSSIKTRVARISKLLSESHGIPKDRLKFVYSESDIQSNRIYLLPPDAINSFSEGEENLEKIRPASQTSKKSSVKN